MDSLTFLEKKPTITSVSLFGVPLDLGKDNMGTELAPKALRAEGLVHILQQCGIDVRDLGDMRCPSRAEAVIGDPTVKYLQPIIEALKPVASLIQKEINDGQTPVVFGGDHTIAIATISGAASAVEGDMGVIWIDAHADINTHETTRSGNIHGMPLSAVLGLGHQALVDFHVPGQKIKKQNVVYVGLKDLDQAEIDIIREQGITAFTVMDLDRFGLEPVFEAIAAMQKRVAKIWVSLDIDSIDEEFAPGTPMVNKGGLSYREIAALTTYIGKKCVLAGFDVVELSPEHDNNAMTVRLAIELITRLLGTEYSWYTNYMDDEEQKKIRRQATEKIDAVHNS